ncbi:hypothetical protein Ancab_017586 [Ancistrocladus abbreviatus]
MEFLLLLLLSVSAMQLAFCGQIVEYLPGYPGKLPFKLETGYISVGESEMFYYFIESQGNPKEDPLFLWLTGGPGCSSFNGLIYEIGPMEFDIDSYDGGLPRLKYYPYAWTKTASILFLDSPVGTGFSYSRTVDGWPSSDTKAAKEAYEFFMKWLAENPKYLPLQIFVGGDSYSGIIVPLVTKHIVKGNEKHEKPRVNLKGYLLGSPRTDSVIDNNSKVTFAHRMALISDEIYEAARKSCNENYVDVDPTNTACVTALDLYQKCVKDVWTNDILEPNCVFASSRPHETWNRRSLEDDESPNFILSPPKIPNLWCRTFNYALADFWANDGKVQEALHVRKGMVKEWMRCNQTISYTKNRPSVVYVHRFLSTQNLLVLVECGDRDMVVPFVGTVQWIKSLNLTIDVDWRPWFVDGQVAGYTRKFTENQYRLTYATVKGGGHTAPEYFRRRCYFMFDRWVHYYPL